MIGRTKGSGNNTVPKISFWDEEGDSLLFQILFPEREKEAEPDRLTPGEVALLDEIANKVNAYWAWEREIAW